MLDKQEQTELLMYKCNTFSLQTELNSFIEQAFFQVSYFTSISRQQEFEKSAESVTQLFSITYFIAILFSVLSCARFVSHFAVLLKFKEYTQADNFTTL